ncbi:MAG: hypothetical protein EU539_04810 [Promethearchaeota archaeon]|nr:MAG: hypothetical protein EU539_04810 [Candidatus Lokiarchaeota archaeon]
MITEKKKDDNESCQSTTNPSKWNGRTIEIDDAGTGDLVGDAFIGFYDTETGKTVFQSIPVGLYNEDNRGEDRPKKHIVKIVKKGLKKLNHGKGDRILLCRGSCFDLVREYFEENDIYYEPAIVEGELQDAVEGRYVHHLRKLGVTSRKLTKESGAQRYFVLFDWVCRDFPNRERFVKTGFPSWKKKWRKVALRRYNKYQNKESRKAENIIKRAHEIYNKISKKTKSLKEASSEI